jgi:hypothetical protein
VGITLPVERLALLVALSEPANDPSCPEVIAIIQCYVDCECDVATMVAIAAHLSRCEACDAELQALRWLKAAVRRCAGHDASVWRIQAESRSWF